MTPSSTSTVRDLVIVVPGIIGSELVSADGTPLWSLRPGTLPQAIRTMGRYLNQLTLPDDIKDGPASDGVRATALLGKVHSVPGLWSPDVGYGGLMELLRSDRFNLVEATENPLTAANLIEFPYDWRLSNRYNGKRLAKTAMDALNRWRQMPGMSEAKIILVCHSMGGLVARWFAEQEGGGAFIRALVTVGTPFRGSIKALNALVNGLDPRLGPLHLPLSAFVRSLPSVYQLLPQYNCIKTAAGRTDLLAAGASGLDIERLKDATLFHQQIAGDPAQTYTLHKVVGIRQPTPTTAQWNGATLEMFDDIDGHQQGGDGTVPRLSAEPALGRGEEVHEAAFGHGALVRSRSLLDLVDGIITREDIIWQAGPEKTAILSMADTWSTTEEPILRVLNLEDKLLWVSIFNEQGQLVGERQTISDDGSFNLGLLPEGGYRAVVESEIDGEITPSTKPFVVFDSTAA
ncbi:MAG: hypothetical protein AAFY33_11730 [Cyanobacteria bacterium J06643_4]